MIKRVDWQHYVAIAIILFGIAFGCQIYASIKQAETQQVNIAAIRDLKVKPNAVTVQPSPVIINKAAEQAEKHINAKIESALKKSLAKQETIREEVKQNSKDIKHLEQRIQKGK